MCRTLIPRRRLTQRQGTVFAYQISSVLTHAMAIHVGAKCEIVNQKLSRRSRRGGPGIIIRAQEPTPVFTERFIREFVGEFNWIDRKGGAPSSSLSSSLRCPTDFLRATTIGFYRHEFTRHEANRRKTSGDFSAKFTRLRLDCCLIWNYITFHPSADW